MTAPAAAPDPLQTLSIDEVAGLLGMHRQTVKDSYSDWPHLRFGTRIRFTRRHVEEIYALHEQRPPAQLALVVDLDAGRPAA